MATCGLQRCHHMDVLAGEPSVEARLHVQYPERVSPTIRLTAISDRVSGSSVVGQEVGRCVTS